MLALGLIKPK